MSDFTVARKTPNEAYNAFVKRAAKNVNDKFYGGSMDTRTDYNVVHFLETLEDVFGEGCLGPIYGSTVDAIHDDIVREAELIRDGISFNEMCENDYSEVD